jgi:hypothetical protein
VGMNPAACQWLLRCGKAQGAVEGSMHERRLTSRGKWI